MPQQELLNKKSVYTLTSTSAVCYGSVALFNDLYDNAPPFSPILLVLVIALVVSFGAVLFNSRSKKDFTLYITALFNTILITTSALGLHGGKQNVTDNVQEKKDTVIKSSFLSSFDKYPWLPPLTLVKDIADKEDTIKAKEHTIEAKEDALRLERAYYKVLSQNDSNRTKNLKYFRDSVESNPSLLKKHKEDAEILYKRAYEHLEKNNFREAMDNFRKTEKAYPTYGNAFEIFNYLRKNQDKFKTQPDELKNFIIKNYSWKAPELQPKQ